MIVITQSQKALLQNVEVLYQPLAKITPRAMAVFWRRSYNMACVLNVSWTANWSSFGDEKKKAQETVMEQEWLTNKKHALKSCLKKIANRNEQPYCISDLQKKTNMSRPRCHWHAWKWKKSLDRLHRKLCEVCQKLHCMLSSLQLLHVAPFFDS